jgi:transposase
LSEARHQEGPRLQTSLALKRLRRVREIDDELRDVERDLVEFVRQSGTSLVDIPGVGWLIAARILAEVGDVRRFRSQHHFASANGTAPIPASSGQTTRHRLNRGGNRRLNRAIHLIALTQARCDPRARAYVDRRRSEGKSRREAIRCLKRRLSDVVYRCLLNDVAPIAIAA